MDTSFFTELRSLHQDERYWISTLFLKIIYADNRVDVKEIPYVAEVLDLLDNSQMLVESARQEAMDLSVEKCTHILIGYNLTEQLLICLLEICTCDDDFDDRELVTIGEIASEFGYKADQFDELVSQVMKK